MVSWNIKINQENNSHDLSYHYKNKNVNDKSLIILLMHLAF